MLRFLLVLSVVIGSYASAAEPPAQNLRYQQMNLPATGLDAYVGQPDDSFDWHVVSTQSSDLGRFVVIQLTSQTWQPDTVAPGVWKHWLKVCIPNDATGGIGMLFVGGGRHDAPQPRQPAAELLAVAVETKSIVAELHCVPNQPLVFNGDGVERFEDNLLAESWQAALKTKDPSRLGQLPMAKSAVRAMDALEQWSAGDDTIPTLNQFVVSGASKRGWTTWLTGAVDTRVVAIIPIVIDVLNIRQSLQHQLDVYGEWSPALGDYHARGFDQMLTDPRFDKLLAQVDPYLFRQRFTMPKLVVNATGDQFFLPDSSQFYFDGLPTEKHLAYVPNASHSLGGSNAQDTIMGFYSYILAGQERPTLHWQATADGDWQVTSDVAPNKVRLWQANNPKARDFRLDVVGAAYKGVELTPADDGSYRVPADKLKATQGWTATLVEAEYDSPCGRPLRLTTPVWIHGTESE